MVQKASQDGPSDEGNKSSLWSLNGLCRNFENANMQEGMKSGISVCCSCCLGLANGRKTTLYCLFSSGLRNAKLDYV